MGITIPMCKYRSKACNTQSSFLNDERGQTWFANNATTQCVSLFRTFNLVQADRGKKDASFTAMFFLLNLLLAIFQFRQTKFVFFLFITGNVTVKMK